jgi:phospholipase C
MKATLIRLGIRGFAPPKADRWGPGSRVPTIIVSPFAKRYYVDHTLYDTTSILRFITRRFDLPKLPGLIERDAALAANHSTPLGDLTGALNLSRRWMKKIRNWSG